MKRSPLKRTAGLKRKSAPAAPSQPLARSKPLGRGTGRLRRARPQNAVEEPGRAEWKARHRGNCQACGKPGWLVRHHVLREQDVRRAGGDPWSARNAFELGDQRTCHCHHDHHWHIALIPMRKVPDDAVDFARGLLGPGRAYEYFRRHYRDAIDDPRVAALLQTHNEGSYA